MDYQNLQIRKEGRILYVVIDRPKNMNALNIATFVEIDDVLERHQYDKEIFGLIITGSGKKAFVAGADISEFADFAPEEGKTMSENGHRIFNKIESFPKPVIAAVNGFALGGGCELAMSCHIRVASENARFGQPEVNLGIIPGYGGTQRLAELVGKGKAIELLLTGDMIKAPEALSFGLVNYVVSSEDLLAKCEEIINKIATKGPLAIQKVIECVNARYRVGNNIGDGYHLEVEKFAECMSTDDFVEGTKAFLEKRTAEFKGN